MVREIPTDFFVNKANDYISKINDYENESSSQLDSASNSIMEEYNKYNSAEIKELKFKIKLLLAEHKLGDLFISNLKSEPKTASQFINNVPKDILHSYKRTLLLFSEHVKEFNN